MSVDFLQLFFVTFISLLSQRLIRGQLSEVSLTDKSPIDVIIGGVVCHNVYPVEFTCVGINIPFLEWRRNGITIGVFTVNANMNDYRTQESLTVFLDSITRSTSGANMTSRLVGNLSNLNNGDRIECIAINTEDMVTLDYTPKEPPSTVPTNFSVSIVTGSTIVNMSITWDSAFNLVHNVTFYSVSISNGAVCPSSCDPSGPCKCTGLRVGENTIITISAINCGNQMGPPVSLTATPQVPSRPTDCNSLPIYTIAGDLSAVDLTWTVAPNPPEFLPGVSQDVTQYFIIEDMRDATSVMPSLACSTGICSYTFSPQSSNLPNSPFSVSVSAQNVVGRGEMCTPQTEIDSRNQVFSLILNTTTLGNQTVSCTQLSGGTGTFECEFCYSAGESYQNLTTCISVNETPTLLSSLTELTYCYRATASINGVAVTVIQDTFNTACPPGVLGTAVDEQTNSRCRSGTLRSVSIPNGVGCVNGDTQGSVTTYRCDKWYRLSGDSHRTCRSDGNWDGEVPVCELNGVVIALLVLSILEWIASAVPTVFGVILLIKEVPLKDKYLFNFHILLQWPKITYVVLLTIEFLFLLLVLVLWIAFGVILDNPNSESQQTSLLIAAFVLALVTLLCITGALIFLYLATKCVQDVTKGNQNTPKTPEMPVYAVPDKSKKKRLPQEEKKEDEEHTSGPNNLPKWKGIKVNKQPKAKKEPPQDIELKPTYGKFEGPGHHLDDPIPKPVARGANYDVLIAEGQRNSNQQTSGSHDQAGAYSIPGEHEREYSEVEKRSSQKRLLDS